METKLRKMEKENPWVGILLTPLVVVSIFVTVAKNNPSANFQTFCVSAVLISFSISLNLSFSILYRLHIQKLYKRRIFLIAFTVTLISFVSKQLPSFSLQAFAFRFTLLFSCLCLQPILMKIICVLCPLTFSLSEALLVSTIISLVLTGSFFHFEFSPLHDLACNDRISCDFIIALLTETVFCLLLCYVAIPNSTKLTLFTFLNCLLMIFRSDSLVSSFRQFLIYLFDKPHGLLVLLWLSVAFFSVLISPKTSADSHQREKKKAMNRKFFHFVHLFCMCIGLTVDMEFSGFAKAIVIFVFLLIEIGRNISTLKHLTFVKNVNNFYFDLADEVNESGKAYLTHIYLYFGCAFPLWVYLYCGFGRKMTVGGVLCVLSGVTAIDIGDTFASLVGVQYGKRRFFGGRKTFEGVMAGFVTMFIFQITIYLLISTNLSWEFLKMIVPLIACSVAEGLLYQIDNLFLPLFLFALNLLFGVNDLK